jgi:hypothetical protein
VVKRGGVHRWSDEKLNSGLGTRKVEATPTQCPFAKVARFNGVFWDPRG